MKCFLGLLFMLCQTNNCFSQDIIKLDSAGIKTHSRAIFIFNSKIWLGDNKGEVSTFHLLDSSRMKVMTMQPEIRDIYVADSFYIVMQTGDTGKIVFQSPSSSFSFTPLVNNHPVFLDGFDVKGNLGFLMGDPIDGIFSLYKSNDFGQHWETMPGLKAFDGEAAYAASGSTVSIHDNTFYFVTGGMKSRIFVGKKNGSKWKSFNIPFPTKEGSGPYSLCVLDHKRMVVVGGNYMEKNRKDSVCFYSKNGGKSWQESIVPPNGYRSCVISNQGIMYSCGSNGADFSIDNGKNWHPWLKGNFLAMAVGDSGKIYLSMANNLGIQRENPIRILREI